jgi:hypothetical protein
LAQILQQGGIAGAQRVPATAVAPYPAVGQRAAVEILQAPADRATRYAGGPRHRRHTAVADDTHFRRRIEASSPLIQLVAQRRISFLNESNRNRGRLVVWAGKGG